VKKRGQRKAQRSCAGQWALGTGLWVLGSGEMKSSESFAYQRLEPSYPVDQGSHTKSPHIACSTDNAATAAVSVRNTRGPSRTGKYPAASA
jgi:hypothetical protein